MQEYFANFIKTADPNGPGLVPWPPTSSGKPVPVMHIGTETKIIPDKYGERYLLMRQVMKK